MSFENILFTNENHIGTIIINRPKKLNALNGKTLEELNVLFSEIKNNKDVYVVIITGAGEKSFVAGADISELNKCDELTGAKFAKNGQEVFDLIENLGKPVIAAINGFALGGGCELALACHMRFASENAKFGQPEVNLGVIPGYGGTQRLSRLVGTGIASEMILTGDLINSEKAKAIGLVNDIFSQENLMEEVYKIANKIASKGQRAISLALKSIVSVKNIGQNDGLNLEADLFGECCGTDDFKEGTTAFLEKRPPKFLNN